MSLIKRIKSGVTQDTNTTDLIDIEYLIDFHLKIALILAYSCQLTLNSYVKLSLILFESNTVVWCLSCLI